MLTPSTAHRACRALVPLAVLAWCIASRAAAQGDERPDPEALRYVVSTGDTIAVTVVGRDDLSAEVRIPRGGAVILPGVGLVRVTGLSVEELSAKLVGLLEARERLRGPRVLVSVVAYAPKQAFVYGAVTNGHAIALPDEAPMTLTQAIASCGGFVASADRARVRIRRRGDAAGAAPREIDAQSIALGAAPGADEVLEPGDTIYVPTREPVYVLGEVKKQGPIVVPAEFPLTVSRAIAMSEGFTAYARETRVRVMRRTPEGQTSFVLNVAKVLADGELDKDMQLRPGDIVYVPERVF
jgi:polysaccharide export outer membrane protein